MMTNKEIVEANLDLITTCINCQFSGKKDKQFKEDFKQDLLVYLLMYDNEKLNNAVENNHLNALITKCIRNQIFSFSSKYWRQYERWDTKTEDLTKVEDLEDGN